MENAQPPLLTVSDFIAFTNQTLEFAYPAVNLEGEVAGFKINQNKYVFFDLKDEGGSVSCFMPVWQLRVPIEDGMKVIVAASPKLTQWGKFSLTVRTIRPSGEGSLKKSFDLLRMKLEKEGLFAQERKRPLPEAPQRIAVISSMQSAGYADFMKILNDRWGGINVDVAHVHVQGDEAPDQIIRALGYFNSQAESPEVIVIIRGGGSADDLRAFNDELLVREIASSRIPTLVGIGHETDVSLADLVADKRAATPSNAAQLVVPDRGEVIRRSREQVNALSVHILHRIEYCRKNLRNQLEECRRSIQSQYERRYEELEYRRRILAELNPERILARGYAIVRGRLEPGHIIEIEKTAAVITAEVKNVRAKED